MIMIITINENIYLIRADVNRIFYLYIMFINIGEM